MNRHEFMQELSRRTGLTQVTLNGVFDTALNIIAEEIHADRWVSFNDLGTFSSKYTKERRLVSPQGKVVIKKAGRVPVFKFTKVFKRKVSGGV